MTSVTRRALPPLLAVLALAGCTAEVRGSAQPLPPEPSATASTAAPATAKPSRAAKPPAAKLAVSVAASANVKVRYVTESTQFRSPSGNIGCEINGEGAYCDILAKDWKPTPKPASCEWDWGLGTHVTTSGKGSFNCASDTVLNASADPLAFGHVLRIGVMYCGSRRDGMLCVNTRTGHGFRLGRASYELF